MFALLFCRRRPPLVGWKSCCFESLTFCLISECPNRPITSSREVRCHNMTGRCLVFRKHLQYPAIQMSAACRINTEVPQWTTARPTQLFSLSLSVCVKTWRSSIERGLVAKGRCNWRLRLYPTSGCLGHSCRPSTHHLVMGILGEPPFSNNSSRGRVCSTTGAALLSQRYLLYVLE